MKSAILLPPPTIMALATVREANGVRHKYGTKPRTNM
jgi:hypothetical protein